jgi:tetratricopeptide (TPR) repeat protein
MMNGGELVEGRFEIEMRAGAGAMGTVYRALDRHSGERVALKVMREALQDGPARFARETGALARLSHPGIVRYVAHGETAAREPYLAMEWLEGEDLSQALARSGLTACESVRVALQAARALGHAHASGVVHRDVKPGNLFFVGGDLARLKIVDFGLVRRDEEISVTRTGNFVGTPGYLAPEQARGERVDARADVFALGCVLFRCLTGRLPYSGADLAVVLSKLLFEPPPRVQGLRPEVPDALDELVARFMSADPDARPADGAAEADELAALLETLPEAGPRVLPPSAKRSLTRAERRLRLAIVIRGPEPAQDDALARLAIEHDADFERPERAWACVTLGAAALRATDLARRAARCALAIRARWPDARLAIATGSGGAADQAASSAVVQRALALTHGRGDASEASEALAARPVALDEATAGLLDARFEVRDDEDGRALVGARPHGDTVRTLLGKPTPCVGRDRELGMLSVLLDDAIEQGVARAALVTGVAGAGKSRLRHEWLRRVVAREDVHQVFHARGDAITAGSPLAMAGQIVRQAAGLRDDEPAAASQRRLRARVARHVGEVDVGRVAEFLGELCGVPFPEAESVQLRVARRDPVLLGDQLRRAWEDWLRAELAVGPVIVVLEDLHWGDLPTVKLVDGALRAHAELPLVVVALARPTVDASFPDLWRARDVHRIPLADLSKRAAERLVRAALGEGVAPAILERIVVRAAGNPFYLEELVRAAAEGREDVPEALLAMVQSRIEGFEEDARRVLRAASVFGQTFWHGGVEELLGRSVDVTAWLAQLARRELVAPQAEVASRGERAFAFRHALIRDAAYAMLTEDDRRLGHRLAGAWLERAGEIDPVALAEHHERGGNAEGAIVWWARAAEHAMRGNDLDGAIVRAQRALELGAVGASAGELHLRVAEACRWRGRHVEAMREAGAALAIFPRGSPRWFDGLAELVSVCAVIDATQVLPAYERVVAVAPAPGAEAARLQALARFVPHLHAVGAHEAARDVIRALESVEAAALRDDPITLARIAAARSRESAAAGMTDRYVALAAEARDLFVLGGDVRNAMIMAVNLGSGSSELGRYEETCAVLAPTVEQSSAMGLDMVGAVARVNLGSALAATGQLDAALPHFERAARWAAEAGHPRDRRDRAWRRGARALARRPYARGPRAGAPRLGGEREAGLRALVRRARARAVGER